MTAQSNAELREAINDMWKILVSELVEKWETNQGSFDLDPYTDQLLTLFQSQQRQLLQGLMEHKKEFESRIDDVPVYLHAVPVSVIQNKLEGLS